MSCSPSDRCSLDVDSIGDTAPGSTCSTCKPGIGTSSNIVIVHCVRVRTQNWNKLIDSLLQTEYLGTSLILNLIPYRPSTSSGNGTRLYSIPGGILCSTRQYTILSSRFALQVDRYESDAESASHVGSQVDVPGDVARYVFRYAYALECPRQNLPTCIDASMHQI